MIITSRQQKQINKIGKKYSLKLVLLFGSQVKGYLHKDSDLDIAVLDENEETYERFGELFGEFSRVFQGHNVDLVFLKNADPLFRYEITSQSQLLYGDPLLYCEFQAYSFRDYMDKQDLFRLREILLQKKHKLLKEKIYA